MKTSSDPAVSMFVNTPFNPDVRSRLRYRINYQSVAETFGPKGSEAYDMALSEIRAAFAEIGSFKLFDFVENGDFAGAERLSYDIFVSFGFVDGKDDKGIENNTVGITTFPTNSETQRRYAQIQMDEKERWRMTPKTWKWWNNAKPRLLHWLIHEILHALGCGHTTNRVAQNFPSNLDENDWGSDYTRMRLFDIVLLFVRHGREHPQSHLLG